MKSRLQIPAAIHQAWRPGKGLQPQLQHPRLASVHSHTNMACTCLHTHSFKLLFKRRVPFTTHLCIHLSSRRPRLTLLFQCGDPLLCQPARGVFPSLKPSVQCTLWLMGLLWPLLLISFTSLCFRLCFIYITKHRQSCILFPSLFLFAFLAFLSGFY